MDKKDKAVMTSRQAAELDFAFQRNGWTASDIKNLSKGDVLARVLEVVRGQAEIKLVIDCDLEPFAPADFKVLNHIKSGRIQWDPVRFILYQEHEQRLGSHITGDNLYERLRGKKTFNANMLDYFLSHQKLIPDSCYGGKRVFFWDTTYENSGYMYVRYLEQTETGWISGVYPMKDNFGFSFFFSATYVS